MGDFACSYDKEKDLITITNNGSTVVITSDQFLDISTIMDKQYFYSNDVLNSAELEEHIDKVKDELANVLGINASDIDSKTLKTYFDYDYYVETVVDNYIDYRYHHDTGCPDSWTWQECLEQAFDDVIIYDFFNCYEEVI